MTALEQYHEIGRRRAESACKLREAMQSATNAVDRGDWSEAFDQVRQAGNHLVSYRRRLSLEQTAHGRLEES